MRKLILVVAVAVVTAIVFAIGYVDYTIYKAKYPNTSFWMWLVDGK